MVDGFKTKTTGLKKVFDRMNRIKKAPELSVRLGTKATSGRVKRKDGKIDVSRSAMQNLMVLKSQAKKKRDVAFISSADHNKGNTIWRDGIIDTIKGIGLDPLIGRANRLGKNLVNTWINRIEQSISRKGKMRPLKGSVQKQKDREVGPGKPPLIRTGQLMRSLVFRVIKWR